MGYLKSVKQVNFKRFNLQSLVWLLSNEMGMYASWWPWCKCFVLAVWAWTSYFNLWEWLSKTGNKVTTCLELHAQKLEKLLQNAWWNEMCIKLTRIFEVSIMWLLWPDHHQTIIRPDFKEGKFPLKWGLMIFRQVIYLQEIFTEISHHGLCLACRYWKNAAQKFFTISRS